MDYLSFYGLEYEPFSNAPVGRFYFESTQHSEALVRLHYTLRAMKGLSLLVGPIGAGKTTLARRLLNSLSDDEYEAALLVVIHRDITADWLLQKIARLLGVDQPASEKLALLSQVYRRLVQIHDAGKKAVILIDEAQMLETQELMEEFRGLLNLEVPGKKLLSFVFFGLPELELNLKKDPPLEQRVALRVHLSGLDVRSTEAYIEHRLRLAGASRPLFDRPAIDRIYDASQGFPRVVNTLCDNALLEGALRRKRRLDGPLLAEIVENLGLIRVAPKGPAPAQTSHLPTMVPELAEPLASEPPSTDAALEEIDEVLRGLGQIGPL